MANMVKVLTEEYISRKSVESALIFGGMSSVFTVQFVKNNGELRTITGTLVAPIEGPLGVNVTLMTEEGYKSFNTGAVVSISFTDGGQG
jgi:hypothetical protein